MTKKSDICTHHHHTAHEDTFTKVDRMIWIATMADDDEALAELVAPMRQLMDGTIERVPMSKRLRMAKPNRAGLEARSVVGGVYVKLLEKEI